MNGAVRVHAMEGRGKKRALHGENSSQGCVQPLDNCIYMGLTDEKLKDQDQIISQN